MRIYDVLRKTNSHLTEKKFSWYRHEQQRRSIGVIFCTRWRNAGLLVACVTSYLVQNITPIDLRCCSWGYQLNFFSVKWLFAFRSTSKNRIYDADVFNTVPDGITYKFGDSNSDSTSGSEFGRIIVTFVDALRRNTDHDRLAFGIRTTQRDAALVHVHSATSSDFLHVDLVQTLRHKQYLFLQADF